MAHAPSHTGLGLLKEKERIIASFAHVAHPSQQFRIGRADIALQRFEHTVFTVGRFASSVKRAVQRLVAAQRQSAQDRMFWELALTDHRLMAEIRAIEAHAEAKGAGRN